MLTTATSTTATNAATRRDLDGSRGVTGSAGNERAAVAPRAWVGDGEIERFDSAPTRAGESSRGSASTSNARAGVASVSLSLRAGSGLRPGRTSSPVVCGRSGRACEPGPLVLFSPLGAAPRSRRPRSRERSRPWFSRPAFLGGLCSSRLRSRPDCRSGFPAGRMSTTPEQLRQRALDWVKLAGIWYRVPHFVHTPKRKSMVRRYRWPAIRATRLGHLLAILQSDELAIERSRPREPCGASTAGVPAPGIGYDPGA